VSVWNTRPRARMLPALLALNLAMGLALAAIVSVAQAPTAAAHAKYESSVPASNSTVTEAPTVVTVHFAEEVNPAGSDLIVYDTKGNKVSTAAGQVDTNDAKTMTVPMAGNDSESYMVVWHTVSLDDGDAAVGAFIFNVGSTAKAGDGGGSTTTTGASAAAESASSGIPGWVVVLVGGLGLVVGSAGAFVLAGRRSQLKG
jgi:methionine-rich copper-binding protein CopC